MGYKEECLSDEQREIYNRMVNGENIFLTGNAGTGKSFLVEAYSEYCEENNRNILKTAPTGVSANNINGVTIHRQFLLKTDVVSMLETKHKLPKKADEALSIADALLIEEISMARIDVFDKVMSYVEAENRKRRKKHKKEIQLIFVGDFFQLPPVITSDDRPILEEHYGKPIGDGFAFQSKYWKAHNVRMCRLTEIRRQAGEQEFCLALDQCKIGDNKCLNYFNNCTASAEQKEAVWLCGKNNTAFNKNKERLDLLRGEEYTFDTKYFGNVSKKDRLCDDVFVCKVGARVIMTENNKGFYQNGSIGTISDIDIKNNKITVAIDKFNDDGTEAPPIVVEVEKRKISKFEYEIKEKTVAEKLPVKKLLVDVKTLFVGIDEDNILADTKKLLIDIDNFLTGKDSVDIEKILTDIEKLNIYELLPDIEKLPDGSYTKKAKKKKLCAVETGYAEQFPMKLGYAITVHKSQGQTYKAMNFVPEIFQNGQLYVALSRCKSPDKLYIKSQLYSSMLQTSQEVVNYYNSPETYSFFGDENDIISVPITKKAEKAVLLLNELYAEDENVIEIMNFLETLRKDKKESNHNQLSFF